MPQPPAAPDVTAYPDLASRRLGGGVVWASDEYFAAADRLVADEAPVFTPHTFGPHGQVYDGWESRRRRDAGHDAAIVRLGAPGVVRAVVVDTSFFVGNYPPTASVQACGIEGYPSAAELAAAEWETIVPAAPLKGDTRNVFPVAAPGRYTHVRLAIYPDGGVARLRVHGEVVPDPRLLAAGPVDLAALESGARVTGCSDMFYSSPDNLLLPDRARVMGEGWETARRRDDGNDWVVVRLAAAGRVHLVELDTTHFKGNAPDAAELRGRSDPAAAWFGILPRTRLQPDTRHRLRVAPTLRPPTEVRLDIHPDGGLARLRLWGTVTNAGLAQAALRWFNLLPPAQATAVLTAPGGAGLAADAAAELIAARPLTDALRLPVALRGTRTQGR